MARSGDVVNETIAISIDAGDTVRRVLQVITSARSHQIAVAGPASYRLVRRYRPMWAVPLLFLRKTEECGLAVVSGDRGPAAYLQLTGRLPRTTLSAIRLVLEPVPPRPPAMPDPVGTGPRYDTLRDPVPMRTRVPAVVPVRAETPVVAAAPPSFSVGRVAAAPARVPAQASPPDEALNGTMPARHARHAVRTGGWVVMFDQTGDQVPVDGLVLIGRDPQFEPGESGRLAPIVDPDFSISKTHVALGVDDGGMWVMDRHSLNGTTIARDGGEVICQPTQRVYVRPGESVYFGERMFTVRQRHDDIS